MIAGYSDLQISAPNQQRRLDIALQLENRGQDTWSPDRDYAVSYQVFDAATDNLILDGPRTALPFEVPPGGSLAMRLSVELPAESGHYRVFLSPLREHVAWFFQQGSAFVRVDAEVREGSIDHQRAWITTISRFRLEQLARSVRRAFAYPLTTMGRNWSLIRSLVRRDIVGRYRGSYGGLFWTVIHPLLMMLTYWFVFGLVLQTRFGIDGRPSNFVVYFLAGMLPWLAFSEAVGRAPGIVIEHSNFVKKLLFPVEILPVTLVLAGLLSEFFGVGIFLGALALLGYSLPVTALYLPLILVPQFLFTLGLCWFFAALGVFFRDLGQLIGFLLTVWFFTTPICYPEAALPQDYLWLFTPNPMYVLVRAYRSIFLEAAAPAWQPLIILTAVGAAAFVAGHAWFYRLKRSFADMV